MTHEPFYLTEKDPEKFLRIYLTKYRTTYYHRKAKEVLRLIPRRLEGKRFLDVGCCGGFFSVVMAKRGAIGIGCDISKFAVNAAKLHAKKADVSDKVSFKTGDATTMKLSGKFDIIIVKDVVEHIKDDVGFMRKLASFLAPDGQLIITTQNKSCFNYYFEGALRKILYPHKRWIGWDPTHLRWYTPSSLRKKLKSAGLKTERFSGSYYLPYEILYKKILKCDLGGGILALIDDLFGDKWPFDRHGWSISVSARKSPKKSPSPRA